MNDKDTKELEETIQMLQEESELPQSIRAELSFGNFVVTPEKLFLEIMESLYNTNLKGNTTEIVDVEDSDVGG